MKLYLPLRSIPELTGLTRKEQFAAWNNSYPKAHKHWQVWIGLILGGLCGGVGVIIGRQFGVAVLGAVIGGGLGGVIYSQFLCHFSRPYIREYLKTKQNKINK